MPATPATKRKPLFHSDLRGNPVRLSVLTAPKASRFPGRLPYTRVRLAEDVRSISWRLRTKRSSR